MVPIEAVGLYMPYLYQNTGFGLVTPSRHTATLEECHTTNVPLGEIRVLERVHFSNPAPSLHVGYTNRETHFVTYE